jgi:hypothetical protein
MDSGQFELGAYRLDAQSRMLFREGCGVSIWPCPPRWPRPRSPPCRPRMLIREGLRAISWLIPIIDSGDVGLQCVCPEESETLLIGKRTAKRRRQLRGNDLGTIDAWSWPIAVLACSPPSMSAMVNETQRPPRLRTPTQ